MARASVAGLCFPSWLSPPLCSFLTQKPGWAGENQPPPPVFLLYSHSMTVKCHSSGHQTSGSFPHWVILCDTAGQGSYNSTWLWHYPLRDCIRFHRVRTQSHKTVLPNSDPATSSRSPGYPEFCMTWLYIGGSHDLLPLAFNYLLEWLRELRETLIYVYQFLKEYD